MSLSLLYPLFLIPAPGRMSARHGRQRLTNARSCRIGDMTAASEAKTPTEPSKRQFAEGRGRLCARRLLCLLQAVNLNATTFEFLPPPVFLSVFYGSHFFQRMDALFSFK
jgi:hypothetical protein